MKIEQAWPPVRSFVTDGAAQPKSPEFCAGRRGAAGAGYGVATHFPQ